MRSKDISCFPSIFHFVPCATLNQVLSCTITTMQRGATSMVLNLCTSCQLLEPVIFVYCSFSNNNIVWTGEESQGQTTHSLPRIFFWSNLATFHLSHDLRPQANLSTNAWIKAYSHIQMQYGAMLCMKIYMYVCVYRVHAKICAW